MKKRTKRLSLIIAVFLLLSTLAPFASANEETVSGGAAPITLNYSGCYPRMLLLGYNSIALCDIPASDDYNYIMLTLLDESGREQYKETAARDNFGSANFSLPRSLRGSYELCMYRNFSEQGTYSEFLDGIRFFVDDGFLCPISSPVLGRERQLAASESRDIDTVQYYLRPSSGIQSDDPLVIETANAVTAGLVNNYAKALALHDWVCDNIYYDEDVIHRNADRGDESAVGMLKSRKGVCVGYANLLAALLRASGIPAKVVSGYSLCETAGDYFPEDVILGSGRTNHVWNEAFLDGRWVVIDATWDSGNTVEYGSVSKAKGCYQHRYFDISRELLALDHTSYKFGNYSKLYLYMDFAEFRLADRWFMLTDDGTTPVMVDGRTLAPVRTIIEAMGGSVQFTPETEKYLAHISCKLNRSYAQFWIGSDKLLVDGQEYRFDVKPQLVNGHAMVSIGTLLRAMGCDVTWDSRADEWDGRVTIGFVA